MFLADDFRPLVSGFDPGELEGTASEICGLRRDLTLAFRNEAWTHFGRQNDGPPDDAWDDRCVLDAIAGPARALYEGLYREAQATRKPLDHTYVCPSPERFRRFRMRVVPVEDGALLVVHHLVVERRHRARARLPTAERYLAHGVATVCSHCRRTRRGDDPHTWDWVPSFLRRCEVPVSHGICAVCFGLYYARPAKRLGHRA